MIDNVRNIVESTLSDFQFSRTDDESIEIATISLGDFSSLYHDSSSNKYVIKTQFSNSDFDEPQIFASDKVNYFQALRVHEITCRILCQNVISKFFDHMISSIHVPMESFGSNAEWVKESVSILNLESIYIAEPEYSVQQKYNGYYFDKSEIIEPSEKISNSMFKILTAKNLDIKQFSREISKAHKIKSVLGRPYFQRYIYSDRRYKVAVFFNFKTYYKENKIISERCHNIIHEGIRIQHDSFKRESRYRSYFRHALGNKVGVLKRAADSLLVPSSEIKHLAGRDARTIRNAVDEVQKTIRDASSLPYSSTGRLRADDVLYLESDGDDKPQEDFNPHYDKRGFSVGDLMNSIVREARIARPVSIQRPTTISFRKEVEFIGHVDKVIVNQIISELLTNAGKHSVGNHIELVQDASGRHHHRIAVRNLGYTIDRQDRKEIPSSSYRSKRARRDNIPGSGMGLFEARRTARRAGLSLTFSPNLTVPENWKKREAKANTNASLSLFETTLVFPDHLVDVINNT